MPFKAFLSYRQNRDARPIGRAFLRGSRGKQKKKKDKRNSKVCRFAAEAQALFLPVFTLVGSMVGAAALWSTLYIWVMRSRTLLE